MKIGKLYATSMQMMTRETVLAGAVGLLERGEVIVVIDHWVNPDQRVGWCDIFRVISRLGIVWINDDNLKELK